MTQRNQGLPQSCVVETFTSRRRADKDTNAESGNTTIEQNLSTWACCAKRMFLIPVPLTDVEDVDDQIEPILSHSPQRGVSYYIVTR